MRFALAQDPHFTKHLREGHVERPERLEAALEAIAAAQFSVPLEPFPTRRATDEEIGLCHHPSVWAKVAELTEVGGGNIDSDTYVNPFSDTAARLAVGVGIDLCRAVLEGEFNRGFLLARPPGHHATPITSMGFCLYSTIAIAAKACAALGKRVLVFDWDVHHGNGTQDCLYDHGGSRFVSFHQSPLFPGSGYPDERGEGEGEGTIYNVPLPAGCGDAEYLLAYREIVRPLIRQYDPHILLISAGYDAHHNDLLGGMKVTREGFAHLAALVAEDAEATSCEGRLVGFLEGGYHLGGLAESVVATLDVWSGGEVPPLPDNSLPDDTVKRMIHMLCDRFELTTA